MMPFEGEEKEDFLKRVAEHLGEYFDVVQIFAQIDTPEKTEPFSAGIGNMFARIKQTECFIERFDSARYLFEPDFDDDFEDDDDKGEEWKD